MQRRRARKRRSGRLSEATSAAATVSHGEALTLFRQWQRVADALARQVHRRVRRAITREEFESIAREALWFAARRFDPSRGVPFMQFARRRVEGAIVNALRLRRIKVRSGRAVGSVDRLHLFLTGRTRFADRESLREERARWLVTVKEFSAPALGDAALSPEDAVALAEESSSLRAAIAELAPRERERELMELLYFGDATLDEAGLLLGLSKSWLSRIHGCALESVRRTLLRERRPR